MTMLWRYKQYLARHLRAVTLCLCVLGIGISFFMPMESAAATLSYQMGTEERTCPDSGIFAARVVECVRTVVEDATNTILSQFSAFMSGTVTVIITLAVVLFGVKLMAGEQHIRQKGFFLIMQIGLVLHFTDNFGGMAPDYFSLIESLQTIVTNSLENLSTNVACSACTTTGGEPYAKIWYRVDCLVGKIYGFGSNVLASGVDVVVTKGLANGLLGIISVAIFSGTIGIFLFISGITAVITLTLFVCRAVYGYLLAITMGGVLISISPLFIPAVLFTPTKHIFNRWLDQLVSMIGQVTILTAAMSLFFVLICSSIQKVEITMGMAYSNAQRTSKPLFPWLKIPKDPNYYISFIEDAAKKPIANKIRLLNRYLNKVGLGASEEEIKEFLDKNIIPPIPSFLNPLEGKTMEPLGWLQVPWVDFGPNHHQIVHEIAIALIMLVIMCYVMSAFIKQVPQMMASMMGPSGIALWSGKQMPLEQFVNKQQQGRKR